MFVEHLCTELKPEEILSLDTESKSMEMKIEERKRDWGEEG